VLSVHRSVQLDQVSARACLGTQTTISFLVTFCFQSRTCVCYIIFRGKETPTSEGVPVHISNARWRSALRYLTSTTSANTLTHCDKSPTLTMRSWRPVGPRFAWLYTDQEIQTFLASAYEAFMNLVSYCVLLTSLLGRSCLYHRDGTRILPLRLVVLSQLPPGQHWSSKGEGDTR
jgi:hypothetical protein